MQRSKNFIDEVFLVGFFMTWLGIPFGSFLMIVLGFVCMGVSIAIWCWRILTY